MPFDPLHLLWLLLPLAAASGWWAARRDQAGKNRDVRQWPSQYFRGVNYLLNEQPDKAIELFTRMLEVNTETVETHLALGSLFRRRGEVERAIRIHQNLMARPTLVPEYRTLALYELAQDYFRAGLLDRAEGLFLELCEVREHAESAMRALLQIYEQEKDWHKAITIAQRLSHHAGDVSQSLLSQYYCELAEQQLQAGRPGEASASLARAMQAEPRCVRARILSGRLLLARGATREAIEEWQSIERQDPRYLDEVIDDLTHAYRSLGDEQGLEVYLTGLLQRHASEHTLLALAETLLRRGALQEARECVQGYLEQHPSTASLVWLLLHPVSPEALPDRQQALTVSVLKRIGETRHVYQCSRCGLRGMTLHWQCPACHQWVTTRPVGGRGTEPAKPVPDHDASRRRGALPRLLS